MTTATAMTCPYCGKPARWVSNSAVYGRPRGKSHMIWLCRPCGTYVGCHQNTRRPLGTLADGPTRKARSAAHRAIDPHWKSKRLTRSEVYRRLNQHFGEEVHIGASDAERCREIVAAAETLFT